MPYMRGGPSDEVTMPLTPAPPNRTSSSVTFVTNKPRSIGPPHTFVQSARRLATVYASCGTMVNPAIPGIAVGLAGVPSKPATLLSVSHSLWYAASARRDTSPRPLFRVEVQAADKPALY